LGDIETKPKSNPLICRSFLRDFGSVQLAVTDRFLTPR
jgi:hypothetical protein